MHYYFFIYILYCVLWSLHCLITLFCYAVYSHYCVLYMRWYLVNTVYYVMHIIYISFTFVIEFFAVFMRRIQLCWIPPYSVMPSFQEVYICKNVVLPCFFKMNNFSLLSRDQLNMFHNKLNSMHIIQSKRTQC